MRGGLPLLTARGAEFPQRVGLSLQRAVGAFQDLLQADSLKDFEALAVHLTTDVRGRRVLAALRRRLAEDGRDSSLFDTAAFTANMERAYHLLWDAYLAHGRRTAKHLVVLEPNAAERAPPRYHADALQTTDALERPRLWRDHAAGFRVRSASLTEAATSRPL